jgi:Uncharacterized protein conserved in archaea
MDTMKSDPDFAKISETLKTALNLSGSPVAVRIVTEAEQIPEGMTEIEETVRHCRMVSLAREGKVFYATDAKHQCGGGAWALGLREKGAALASASIISNSANTSHLHPANVRWIPCRICRRKVMQPFTHRLKRQLLRRM